MKSQVNRNACSHSFKPKIIHALSLWRKDPAILVLGIFLTLAVTLSACARKELFFKPPWQIGEKGVYEVKRDGTVLATWEMRVESDEAGIALVSETTGEDFKESARVKVDPQSLLPEAMSFKQETEQTKASYTATFTADEAIITVEPQAGSDSPPAVRVAIPEGPHFENETLLMSIRAMPLEKGFEVTVNDVVTRKGKVVPIGVKVIREERITTAIGEIEAYVVELVGASQYVWIAKDAPRQMLRLENQAAATVVELVSYQATEPEAEPTSTENRRFGPSLTWGV